MAGGANPWWLSPSIEGRQEGGHPGNYRRNVVVTRRYERRVWVRETERFLGKCCFWRDCKDGWKPFVLPQHWLGVTRSVSVRERHKKGEWEHFIKRHAVYTLSNDPLLDPARPSSSLHPSTLEIHSSISFPCFLSLPLYFHLLAPLLCSPFFLPYPLFLLNQNIFAAQRGNDSLSRITHVYPHSLPLSFSPAPSLHTGHVI